MEFENNKKLDIIYELHKITKEKQELEKLVKQIKTEKQDLEKRISELEKILSQIPPEFLPNKTKIHLSKDNQLKFETATILFIDIHGFKKIAESKNTQEAIDELDQMFYKFNKIARKHNLQRIKTIGDTYMVAGGVPIKNNTNPIDVVLAALEMAKYIKQLHKEYENKKQEFWKLRLGINTGPVRAITWGKKKINYEIKGETVNIATRIATSSDLNKINISANTYVLLAEYFEFKQHGSLPVKYEGNLDMFYVKRLKKEFSSDQEGIYPNYAFKVKYLLRQFIDLQELILDKLEQELPPYLYYHNYKHTIDVINQAELIGLGEEVSEEEILLLKTAALFHDAGHTIQYENHEYYGCQLAKEYLPKFNYTQEQINKICQIILATKLPPKPKNLLEKIICDADLDYLGRQDFIPISNTLFEELKALGKIKSLNEWNKLQVKFLTSHQYFTKTANKLREINKEKQIERIKKLIKWNSKEEQIKFEEELKKL